LLTRKTYETKSAFYPYGFAYLTGLSDLIRVRQNTPAFKIKRKYGSGELLITGSVAAGG
jgi:hypothetical protein